MKDYIKQILKSTFYVVENSDHVTISQEGINNFCNQVSLTDYQNNNWLEKGPFDISYLSKKEKIHLMLTFNALSFSYWNKPYWQVTYKDTTYQRGSWSLLAALFRAREEGIDILNPLVQARITKKDLEHVLRGNIKIPLLQERVKIINQVGNVISKLYGSDFRNLINQTQSAPELVAKIIQSIPSFEDKAVYKGKEIRFYKRAQALVESIDAIHPLPKAEYLTALADYILPKKLRDEKILVYSGELADIIDKEKLIPSKNYFEIEIRANTIWAVEIIKKEFSKKGIKLSSQEINDYLWLTGDQEKTTYHRTRTTDY